MAEDTSDFLASFKNVIQSEMMGLNTSVEGTVESYSEGLATVVPDANKYFSDGDVLPFPKLFRVPIRWPSFNGGLCGVKGPIRAGDKVLVVFAQQARDGTDDERRFDITDAYAIACGNAQVAQASNNADMIIWFGDAYIKLTESGALEIRAPGGSKFITPNNEFTGNNKVDGNQQTIGTTTNNGLTSMNGGFNSSGTATNNGKDIGSNSKHSGVQPGSGISGPVV